MKILIISLWKKYVGLALPLKWLLGSLLGAILGPGLIGFLSEYATYKYSLQIGIRPPLEGIPYLKTTVTTLTLFVTALVVVVVILVRFLTSLLAEKLIESVSGYSHIIELLLNLLRKIVPVKLHSKHFKYTHEFGEHLKRLNVMHALVVSASISIAYTFTTYFISNAINSPLSSSFFIALFVFSFIVVLTIRIPIVAFIASLVAGLLFYGASLYVLFDHNIYSTFLRTIGYGGGIKTILTISSASNKQKECFMLLRTTHSIVCMTPDSKRVFEIPIDKIEEISFLLSDSKSMYMLPKLQW